MKLSEALVLKAEWWSINNLDSEREIETLLNCLCVRCSDSVDWFYTTSIKLKESYPEIIRMKNDATSYLCLLESELQKDEEYEKERSHKYDITY